MSNASDHAADPTTRPRPNSTGHQEPISNAGDLECAARRPRDFTIHRAAAHNVKHQPTQKAERRQGGAFAVGRVRMLSLW
jgi:hypothetical protein